jgi:hypothetical protein
MADSLTEVIGLRRARRTGQHPRRMAIEAAIQVAISATTKATKRHSWLPILDLFQILVLGNFPDRRGEKD